jgi:hypothetical protein
MRRHVSDEQQSQRGWIGVQNGLVILCRALSPLFIFWIPELASQGPGTHVSDVQERFFYFLNFSLEAI